MSKHFRIKKMEIFYFLLTTLKRNQIDRRHIRVNLIKRQYFKNNEDFVRTFHKKEGGN